MKKILFLSSLLFLFSFNNLISDNFSDDAFFNSDTTMSIDEMNKIDPDPTPDINFDLSDIDTTSAQNAASSTLTPE